MTSAMAMMTVMTTAAARTTTTMTTAWRTSVVMTTATMKVTTMRRSVVPTLPASLVARETTLFTMQLQTFGFSSGALTKNMAQATMD